MNPQREQTFVLFFSRRGDHHGVKRHERRQKGISTCFVINVLSYMYHVGLESINLSLLFACDASDLHENENSILIGIHPS